MIPSTDLILQNTEFKYESLPTKTYKIDFEKQKIVGYTDNVEALKQAIILMLSIERYDFIIYSWNYGIELKNLYGKDTGYVMAELERVITEALLQDDRIKSVENFIFDRIKNKVSVTFTVNSIYGDIKIDNGVIFNV